MPISDLQSKITKKDFKLKAIFNKIREQKDRFGREGSGPQFDLFYGFLCLIYDGVHDISEIKKWMKKLFLATMSQLGIKEDDVEEYIHLGRSKKYITLDSDDKVKLTDTGKAYIEASYYMMIVTSHWMRKVLTEKFVMIITAISLVILSLTKILLGLTIDSQGMISEGFENFTDLIKIGIIYLGLRFKKDRIASIIIISLMIITGITMIWSNISALFSPIVIEPNFESYLIIGISILVNYALMYYKGLVGRSSGNLSLLSDSKDSEVNVLISVGVLIGLSFAIFDLYFIDPIIGFFIGILIVKEGYEFLRELIKKEEEFDISAINVKSDNIYDNILTKYLLSTIRGNRLSESELIETFKNGLELGRKYYQGYADFFYNDLGAQTAEKYIKKLIKGGEVEIIDGDLVLTPKGLQAYHKAESKESSHRRHRYKKDVNDKKARIIGILWAIFGISIVILLIIFTPKLIELINAWMQSI
ncbi:MAG: hypothetical protein EU543_00455 [Promethearchaeota archaeon]|nr:MAG: hypothetical protein EU543_00455 [Candidatus Lokiarchaeota archaeon]